MPILALRDVSKSFGAPKVADAISFDVEKGEALGIIGPNGAGKTTLMRSIAGVLRNPAEAVRLKGEPIGHLPADRIMAKGVAMVPEGRRLFPSLTVEENLLIGGQARTGKGPWTLDTVYELFPILRERRNNPGTALSGGQQRMVAIGRAFMSNPDVLLCDEISLGLAPVVIRDIYKAVPRIKDAGASIIVVEQDIGQAMAVSDRVCCMIEGRVTLEGRPGELTREAIHAAYFGAAA
jgi:branched-chain amino acid transport system ATP-binding protein